MSGFTTLQSRPVSAAVGAIEGWQAIRESTKAVGKARVIDMGESFET
jgi:hypothetical protein